MVRTFSGGGELRDLLQVRAPAPLLSSRCLTPPALPLMITPSNRSATCCTAQAAGKGQRQRARLAGVLGHGQPRLPRR